MEKNIKAEELSADCAIQVTDEADSRVAWQAEIKFELAGVTEA
jgi:hypothetical protein